MSAAKKQAKFLFFKKYETQSLLGEGSFSTVYKGVNRLTREEVAVKVENKAANFPLLEREAYFLHSLKGFGIPEVKSYGISGNYNVLVQTLLGKSLYDLERASFYKINVNDLCLVALQVIDRVRYVHSKFIIHKDIKPENLLFGRESDSSVLYLIDFGLSRKYMSSKTFKHIRHGNISFFVGNQIYASTNTLRGFEQSRRDDLESVGYVLLELLNKDSLPWVEIYERDPQTQINKIVQMRSKISCENLCRNSPPQFVEYFKYVRNLAFDDEPDYEFLRNLFVQILNDNNIFDIGTLTWGCKSNSKRRVNCSKRKSSSRRRLYEKICKSLEKKKHSAELSDMKMNFNSEYKPSKNNLKSAINDDNDSESCEHKITTYQSSLLPAEDINYEECKNSNFFESKCFSNVSSTPRKIGDFDDDGPINVKKKLVFYLKDDKDDKHFSDIKANKFSFLNNYNIQNIYSPIKKHRKSSMPHYASSNTNNVIQNVEKSIRQLKNIISKKKFH